MILIKKSIGKQRSKIFILHHTHLPFAIRDRSVHHNREARRRKKRPSDIMRISEIRAAICSDMQRCRAGLNVHDRHGDAIDYRAGIIAGDAFIGRFRDGHVDKINLEYEARLLFLSLDSAGENERRQNVDRGIVTRYPEGTYGGGHCRVHHEAEAARCFTAGHVAAMERPGRMAVQQSKVSITWSRRDR